MNKLDYTDIFDFRGAHYNRACRDYPMARLLERTALLSRLDLSDKTSFCDVPAGGGYLADGVEELQRSIAISCIEPSAHFGQMIDSSFTTVNCPVDSIPLADRSFDAIGSLAGLHHIANRRPVFKEWIRLLKAGGELAVADVALGSLTGDFLNGFVDCHTPQGHDGIFFAAGEFTELMQEQGLEDCNEEVVTLYWQFEQREGAASFCKDLFYLTTVEVEDVAIQLDKLGLHFSETNNQWQLSWELIYAKGKKP